MATVNLREVVDEIIAGNGIYPGDTIRVVKIVQYENMFDGKTAYGLVYEGEPLMRYEESGGCINPQVVWERGAA